MTAGRLIQKRSGSSSSLRSGCMSSLMSKRAAEDEAMDTTMHTKGSSPWYRQTIWRSVLASVALLGVVGMLSMSSGPFSQPLSLWGQPSQRTRLRSRAAATGLRQCQAAFNEGRWVPHPQQQGIVAPLPCGGPSGDPLYATCGAPLDAKSPSHFRWGPSAASCGASRVPKAQARSLLSGQWVAFAGDSVTRFAFGSLLRLLASEGEEPGVVFGHSDFEYELPCGIRASFYWAPFADNVTELLGNWTASAAASGSPGPSSNSPSLPPSSRRQQHPDVLLLGTALWHMLYIGSPSDYGRRLSGLASALRDFREATSKAAAAAPPEAYWLSVTSVFPPKLKTDQKRQMMTPDNVKGYNAAIRRSGVAAEAPLVDMHGLSASCGPSCTEDGIHYGNATYDAAVQVVLNSVLKSRCSHSPDSMAASRHSCPSWPPDQDQGPGLCGGGG